MLTPLDAWNRIATELGSLSPESRTRAEAAGRVLAGTLLATVDQPPADVSAMDGFVVAGEVAAGVEIPLGGESAAGHPPDFTLAPGTAARIMTGAVVPDGGDRVVPVEKAHGVAADRVSFTESPAVGAHIRRGGEIIAEGAPLLDPGFRLGPSALALLAAHGHDEVSVVRQPSVAVLTTGDEVVPPERVPAPGQLRDSNTTYLLAALSRLGLAGRSLGIAPDHPSVLAERIAEGLRADVLLLCGGVSKGEHDHVEDVLAELGCRTLFDSVAIQPGKPLVVARHDGGWVFGLPGNPASVLVCFHLFAAPVLARLDGDVGVTWWSAARRGVLASPAPPGKKRELFLPARVFQADGELAVTPLVPRGSHDVLAWARADALLRIRPGASPAITGAACEVLVL